MALLQVIKTELDEAFKTRNNRRDSVRKKTANPFLEKVVR